MDPQLIIDRILRLVRLDTSVFEEMRDDSGATIAAVVVAAVSFFLSGLGGFLWFVISIPSIPKITLPSGVQASTGASYLGISTGKFFVESFFVGSLLATVLWAAWVAIAYFMLVNVFRYTGTLDRCLRACGLAALPMALSFFMFIPGIQIGVGIAAIGLMFLLMDIGIQVCFDAQPGHVIVSTFAGFVVFCLILSIAVQQNSVFAPGIFVFRIIGTL